MSRVSNTKKPILRMTKNQLSSLVLHEKLITTQSKAKTLKQEAQALISLLNTSRDKLALRRKLNNMLYGKAIDKAVEGEKLYSSVSIFKTEKRSGDSALMSIVTLNTTKENKENKKKV